MSLVQFSRSSCAAIYCASLFCLIMMLVCFLSGGVTSAWGSPVFAVAGSAGALTCPSSLRLVCASSAAQVDSASPSGSSSASPSGMVSTSPSSPSSVSSSGSASAPSAVSPLASQSSPDSATSAVSPSASPSGSASASPSGPSSVSSGGSTSASPSSPASASQTGCSEVSQGQDLSLEKTQVSMGDDDSGKVSAAPVLGKEAIQETLLHFALSGQNVDDGLDADQIEQYVSTLSKGSTQSVFNAICDCEGSELTDLLRGIEVLGRHIDTANRFSLSGMSVATLHLFYSQYVPENVSRTGAAIFFNLLDKENQKVEPFASLLGFSKKRIYSAKGELLENGLYVDDEHPNHAGAGRPSISEEFETWMEPVLVAGGVAHVDIATRQSNRKAIDAAKEISNVNTGKEKEEKEEKAEPDEGSDTDKPCASNDQEGQKEAQKRANKRAGEVLPGPGGAPVKEKPEAGFRYPVFTEDNCVQYREAPTYAEVLSLSEGVKVKVEKAEERLNAWLSSDKTGSYSKYPVDIRTALRTGLEDFQQKLKELEPADGADSASIAESLDIQNTENIENIKKEVGSIVHQEVSDVIRPDRLYMLFTQIQTLDQMCDALMSAMDKLSPKETVYWQSKDLAGKFKLRAYREKLRIWGREYAWFAAEAVRMERHFTLEEIKYRSERNSAGDSDKPACISLEEMEQHTEEALESTKKVLSFLEQQKVQSSVKAREQLRKLEAQFREVSALSLTEDTPLPERSARALLIETLRLKMWMCLDLIQEGKANSRTVRQVSAAISKSFLKHMNLLFCEVKSCKPTGEAEGSQEKEMAPESGCTPEMDDKAEGASSSGQADRQEACLSEEMREALEKGVPEIKARIASLRDDLESFLARPGEKAGRRSKKTLEDREKIQAAADTLKSTLKQFDACLETARKNSCSMLWNAFSRLALALDKKLSKWLKAWGEDTAKQKYDHVFKAARRVSGLVDSAKKGLDKSFAAFENQRQDWERAENNRNGFIAYVQSDDCGDWFRGGFHLSPERRVALARKLWDEGKEPTDLTVWVDYIIAKEYARNYGDPSDKYHCCKITKAELRNALETLTGISFSETAVWNIVSKKMGCTSRQCAKLDQIGESHPLRNQQFEHIKSMVEAAKGSKDWAVLSIDTKASLQLGRMKHDNGLVLCRQEKDALYLVYDHDYGLFMFNVYPNGSVYVDESRMNEKAVLHPLGVYDMVDMVGYVSYPVSFDICSVYQRSRISSGSIGKLAELTNLIYNPTYQSLCIRFGGWLCLQCIYSFDHYLFAFSLCIYLVGSPADGYAVLTVPRT